MTSGDAVGRVADPVAANRFISVHRDNIWYFDVNRGEANDILNAQPDSGTFLVRPSNTLRGDLVLCVKEDSKVSHYIINRIQVAGKIVFRIGDQEFSDVHQLLLFYKTHYLDSTPLRKPAPHQKYMAKYDFAGRDDDDLPFKKGEVLIILAKDEDQWWTAQNSKGAKGSVPVPYIVPYNSSTMSSPVISQQQRPNTEINSTPNPNTSPSVPVNGLQRKLPAKARVIRQRVPCAYDNKAIRLEVGDIVTVTAMNVNGQWEGEVNGRQGFFPFNYIEFINEEEETDNQS
ncbi:hypothetical protein LSH36_175g03010 [Paralvinella palmiformis]|uniref:Adapter molecule Crk n=1 Tax=Paralvinella palmiformis TaxID=53620 RepID=A0AAD9JS50_9ANNE|nr:hypothetical protein LSH36_175g03010 [Paralvinella palmiformis]